jgi:hypothetical protein
MTTTYGFSYRITKFDGTKREAGGVGYEDRTEMLKDWTDALEREGYSPPRWWQFWRWSDYPRDWPRVRFGGSVY